MALPNFIKRDDAIAIINSLSSLKIPVAIRSIEIIEERETGQPRARRLTLNRSISKKDSNLRRAVEKFNKQTKNWWIKIHLLTGQEIIQLATSGNLSAQNGNY